MLWMLIHSPEMSQRISRSISKLTAIRCVSRALNTRKRVCGWARPGLFTVELTVLRTTLHTQRAMGKQEKRGIKMLMKVKGKVGVTPLPPAINFDTTLRHLSFKLCASVRVFSGCCTPCMESTANFNETLAFD